MHDLLPLPICESYANHDASLEEICNSTAVVDLQIFQWRKSITQVSMLVVFISSIGYCLTSLKTDASCGVIAEKLPECHTLTQQLFPFNLPWNPSHCGNLQTECSRHYKTNPVAGTSTSTQMIWVNGSDWNLARLVSICKSRRLSFQISESEEIQKLSKCRLSCSLRYIDPLCVYILWLLNLEGLLYSPIFSWDVVFPYTHT